VYDLEERTFQFAKAVRLFVKTLPKTIANIEDGKQLVKASGSVGANYREANESLSKKDFHRYSKSQNDANLWFCVLVIEYCDLRFICNLVLVIWDLIGFLLLTTQLFLSSRTKFYISAASLAP
jgi:hypothetical protein